MGSGWKDILKVFLSDSSTSPWVEKFAWWPITIHGERVWLTHYYARVVLKGFNQIGNIEREWEYGTIFDVMKGD